MPARKTVASKRVTGRGPGKDSAGRALPAVPDTANVTPLTVLQGGSIPTPPPNLKAAGLARWERLWRHCTYFDPVADYDAVARLCGLRDRIERWEAQIAIDGDTVPGSTGQTRQHPLISCMQTAEREERAIEATLGLSPESRAMMGLAASRAVSKLEQMMIDHQRGYYGR